jgi:hypothetical protein
LLLEEIQLPHFSLGPCELPLSLYTAQFDPNSYLLVRHPRVMQKLRREVTSVFGNSPTPNRDKLRRMHYLQHILKESKLYYVCAEFIHSSTTSALRLYPSVPINNRTARKDTVLPVGGGTDGKSPIFIRKGVTIAFCPYALHRRQDLYGMDAISFRPERWDEDTPLPLGPYSVKWGYIPFGAGPRACIGSKLTLSLVVQVINTVIPVDFAYSEAGYTLVRLLQEFGTLKLPEGEVVEPIGAEKQVMTLVMSIGTSCKVSTA